MAPAALGLLALGLVPVLLLMRLPIAWALALLGGLGMVALHVGQGAGLVAAAGQAATLLSRAMLAVAWSSDLLLILLVVLLGNLAFHAGIATRIYDAAAVLLRSVRGGAAMAAVMGCGGFASISGSSIACATTMGRICIPEMRRQGYDARLAASAVAAGGTLGPLIPPSVMFILYAILTGAPVEQLFLAGILPGLLSLAGMLLVVRWWVRHEPQAAPPPAGLADVSRAEALRAVWPALLPIAIIVAGLLGGGLSAVQALALCVVAMTVIGMMQGRLTPDILWQVLRESLLQSAAIILITAAALIFVGFIALTGLGEAVVARVADWQLTHLTVISVLVLICLLLGMFVQPVGILALTLPFMIPLVQGYGLDLIWFGVIVIKLIEIGMITPPVGLNVFVIGNVARDVGLDRIFAGVSRFLAMDILVLVALVLFPVLATLVPGLMR